MTKLEKVMNGLDCCINHGKEIPRLGTFVCDFKNCTYEHYAGTPCYRILIKDALELLKTQKPRVMTREEIIGWDGYIWLEYNGTRAMEVVLIDHGKTRRPFERDYPTKELYWQTYQKTWRGWTAQPMDEQRKAVKWE